MPVTNRADNLRKGSGKRTPATELTIGLDLATTPGNPNVGTASYGGNAVPAWVQAFIAGTLGAHVDSGSAHDASAITLSVEGLPGRTVAGGISSLTGALPPEPPKLGQRSPWTTFSGIPDWGALKLADGNLFPALERDVHGFWHHPPTPALGPQLETLLGYTPDTEFTIDGDDPETDFLWNSGVTGFDGVGAGLARSGAFTRDGAGVAPQPVVRTTQILPRDTAIDGGTGLPTRTEVVVSGTIYPADRGVLALLYWPPGGDAAAFAAQDLTDKCVAAILLGQGILNSTSLPNCDGYGCDGGPGGIFAVGDSPTSFPGRSSGQYDLDEIHAGVSVIDGSALVPPWDDFDGDTNPGSARTSGATTPAPGQVRLGTDPTAGVDPVAYGIPILGGTELAYSGIATTAQGHLVCHNSILEYSTGEIVNFFKYRLPYLKDYENIPYTPRGLSKLLTKEAARYFMPGNEVSATYEDGTTAVGAALDTAGHYTNFEEDCVTWQIARYRHAFLLPSTEAALVREDVGSYWLVHFKTEADFEKCVRDGVMPWDGTSPYEVYGAVPAVDLESTSIVVNEGTTSDFAPAGPAPDYGMTGTAYHTVRQAICLDPNSPAGNPTVTSEYTWTSSGTDNVTWISGVAYFTPRAVANGAANLEFDSFSITAPAGFFDDRGYRFHDRWILNGNSDPALISSPNPMVIGIAPFAYGEHPSNAGQPSATLYTGTVLGRATDHAGTSNDTRYQRIEVPLRLLGSTGAGQYTDSNGPLNSSTIAYSVTQNQALLGDDGTPAFCLDAKPRVYFRNPLGNGDPTTASLPYDVAVMGGVNSNGQIITDTGGYQLLIHTTRFDHTNQVGSYGNFLTDVVGLGQAYASLLTADKDTSEKFLDEVYRWTSVIAGYDATWGVGADNALQGPGLGGWGGSPIEVRVRISEDILDGTNSASSWLILGSHESPLGADDLQVSGWPDRNPPVADGVQSSIPSSGLLVYPAKDFTAPAIRPASPGDITAAQPDYSAETGIRSYVRAFDTAFIESGTPVAMDGESYVTLRLDGIQLADLEYRAPGPGRLSNGGYAVLLKVPGRTTWMDMGRADGAGPSKQDILLDGAGCQVQDADTFDGVDETTGLVYCQIKCHVGPMATLFKNVGLIDTDKCAVLVRVDMDDDTQGLYNLEESYDTGTETFSGLADPHVPCDEIRGLVGISIVRPE